MTRLWRRRLATQIIGLTLVALIVSQALTFLISLDEYTKKFDAGAKAEFISRASSVTRLMESLSPELREQALSASEGSYLRYWLNDSDVIDPNDWRLQALERLSQPLDRSVDPSGTLGWAGSASPQLPSANKMLASNAADPWMTPKPYLWMMPQPARCSNFRAARGMGSECSLMMDVG